MRQPASLLQGLEQAGILAVLRAPSAEHAVRAVDALVAGGVLGIEITYSTPDAADAIAEAARRHGDAIYLGAGTVLTAAQAHEAVEAGATFLVSPGTDEAVGGREGRGCRLRWRSDAQRGDGSPASRRGCGQDLPCFARRSGVPEGCCAGHSPTWRSCPQVASAWPISATGWLPGL